MIAAAGTPTRLAALALIGGLLVAPELADAQDFNRVVPKTPPATEPPNLETKGMAPPASEDQSVLIPVLKGVVFVPGVERVQTGGLAANATPNQVAAQDLPLLVDRRFQASVHSYVGQPLTRAGLDSIIRLVRARYRAEGHPFIDVTAPPQNVQSGVLQIVVTEYRVGKITVSGNRHFSNKLILWMGGLQTGQTLTLPVLQGALDNYNRNPFLTVSAVAQPGEQPGETDIALQAVDRFPFRVYGGYDNQGVSTLGRDEWFVGFNVSDPLLTGQVLSYQYTRSFEGRYESHSASDVIPLGGSSSIDFFGAYATQTPLISPFFRSDGQSEQISGRFVQVLPGPSFLKQTIQGGMDYKEANNNLEFLGFRILQTPVAVYQFPFTYTGTFTDKLGQTVLENMLVVSPGNMSKNNTDQALQQLVAGADARYVYDQLSLTRTTALPHGVTWIARAMGQVSSGNLPLSEQLAAGGIGSVRGYDTNTALGSEGIIVSQELRSPTFSVISRLTNQRVKDQMQLGIFWDYANLSQHNAFPDVQNSATLSSVGFSVQYALSRYFNLQLDVGRQLIRAENLPSRGTEADISTTVSF